MEPFELEAAGIRVLGEVMPSGDRVVSIYRGGDLVQVISANAAAALGVAIQAVAACAMCAGEP